MIIIGRSFQVSKSKEEDFSEKVSIELSCEE